MGTYDLIRRYVDRRLRRWLMRRAGKSGRGFGRYLQKYLHETLGLFRIPDRRTDLPRANPEMYYIMVRVIPMLQVS